MNDFFENLFSKNSKLHERKKRWVIRQINNDGIFEKTEETFLDEFGSPKTEESSVVYQADCGHMVGFHGPHELIARCSQCNRTLCHRCGNLRCRRCLGIICYECAKVVDERAVYCSTCRFFYYSKKFALFSLRGIHELLSKEIS